MSHPLSQLFPQVLVVQVWGDPVSQAAGELLSSASIYQSMSLSVFKQLLSFMEEFNNNAALVLLQYSC